MTLPAIPRLNVLPDEVNLKLFGKLHEPPTDAELKHLRGVKLEDTSTWDASQLLPLDDITPDSVEKMAQEQWAQYEPYIEEFNKLPVPEKPATIPTFADCWGEYYKGVWIPLEPEELPFLTVFDVETVPFAGTVNAICGSSLGVSPETGEMHWYAYRVGYRPHPVKELIPYRSEGLVIAHNASYDMAMLRSQYEITETKLVSLCTMSMGNMMWSVSNQQEGLFKAMLIEKAKGRGVPRWVNEACGASLSDMHQKMFGYGLDKSVRDDIIKETWAGWSSNIASYMTYNYEDVAATARLFQAIYPLCRIRAPHPATWMGMIHLSKGILRLADDWFEYINKVDGAYQAELDYLTGTLTELAIAYRDSWLQRIEAGETPDDHLDWTPNKSGKSKGLPKWWSKVVKEGVTVKSRLAPLVAGVCYGGRPLRWLSHNARTGTWAAKQEDGSLVPLPHPSSTDPTDNVSSPFMEDFIGDMVGGLMTAAEGFPLLSFTERFVALTNWTMMRKRVAGAQVVNHGQWGNLIKPLAVVAGTQSRRCIDKLWLVAPGVKKERLGTELTGYIQAPEGYKLVGADYDQEESWLATLVADSQPVREGKLEHAYPGYSQYSQVILAGDKDKKTDIHSVTAAMAQTSRQLAKGLNFSSDYGCGMAKLSAMIKAGSGCTKEHADALAKGYLAKTRGKRHGDRYVGGLASDKFNGIAEIISKPAMKSLVLKVQCPAAIDHYNTGKDFITTKSNWVIQTSGVDVLHLTITIATYLMQQYNVSARFATAIHDWLGFWVKEEDAALCQKIMQTAHLLTKAYAHKQMGYDTMQLMGHRFASVDVTKRLVKYPGNPCITPSNPTGFDPSTI